MNIASLLLLLQTVAALLSGAQQNPSAASSTSTLAALVQLGSKAVQSAAQSSANVNFAVPPNSGIWPTVTDLLASPYLDASGAYVRQGDSVQLDQSSISFGDLNNDGLDDAAAIVTQRKADGTTVRSLAAFINQNNILFNIADLPLGSTVTVYAHHVEDGKIVIDMAVAGGPRATSTYELVGNRIMAVSSR